MECKVKLYAQILTKLGFKSLSESKFFSLHFKMHVHHLETRFLTEEKTSNI